MAGAQQRPGWRAGTAHRVADDLRIATLRDHAWHVDVAPAFVRVVHAPADGFRTTTARTRAIGGDAVADVAAVQRIRHAVVAAATNEISAHVAGRTRFVGGAGNLRACHLATFRYAALAAGTDGLLELVTFAAFADRQAGHVLAAARRRWAGRAAFTRLDDGLRAVAANRVGAIDRCAVRAARNADRTGDADGTAGAGPRPSRGRATAAARTPRTRFASLAARAGVAAGTGTTIAVSTTTERGPAAGRGQQHGATDESCFSEGHVEPPKESSKRCTRAAAARRIPSISLTRMQPRRNSTTR
jgi:hypothetical protein